MKTDQLTQGSPAWLQARCGKITASKLADVMTQPRSKADKEAGKLSQTARSYMLDLVAETLTGQPVEIPTTRSMQWGIDNELPAREIYETLTDTEVREVGFLKYEKEPMVGCSPDGLIGDDGGLEIKCPFNSRVHIGYLIDGVLPAEYRWQVIGSMWITGRKWWDFVSYDPRMPDLQTSLFRVRVHRGEVGSDIALLESSVMNFRGHYIGAICKLKGGA